MEKKEKIEEKEAEKKVKEKEKIIKKKNILVIVAHPDDETIWMGGTLLKIKTKNDIKHNVNLTIISLCRKNDRDRAPKFSKVCSMLGVVEYHMSDLDDCEEGYYKEITSQAIIERIFEFTKLNGKKYDRVYTHGENGEYRHIRHMQVHKAVCEMLDKKLLLAKQVFFFSYEKIGQDCIVNKNADKLIKLEKPYLKMKKMLIEDVYGFARGGFEEKSCGDVEGFDVLK
jgi:LmbE family N-acetylglucosaminyl deacetylase